MSDQAGERTILVVEDESDARDWIVLCLEERGYRVLQASDGSKAICMIDEHIDEIDAGVFDIGLGKGPTGADVANYLWRQRLEVPVIFCSGFPRDQLLKDRTIDKGDPFISKPIDPEKLAAALEIVLTALPAAS